MLNEIDGDAVRHGVVDGELIYWQCSSGDFGSCKKTKMT